MSRYVEVPASAITSRLAGAGFQPVGVRGSKEQVWDRCHEKDPRYVVRVYTSLPLGSSTARGCGQDAIRVVGLLRANGNVYPIAKTPRVHRTGTVEGVVERMIERCRDVYKACSAHQRKKRR